MYCYMPPNVAVLAIWKMCNLLLFKNSYKKQQKLKTNLAANSIETLKWTLLLPTAAAVQKNTKT